MTEPHLLAHQEDGIATLTFNQPARRNPLSPDLRERLTHEIARVAADDAVRCVVLRGAGGHFMSGGDIANFQTLLTMTPAAREEMFRARVREINGVMLQILTMPKPVIASVSGAAAGAGMSILLACDIAIADRSAYFSMAYRAIGASPDMGASWLLPRVLGARKAMELALLGERFDAAEAHRIGLINRLVAQDALEAETTKLARALADGPAQALAATRKLIQDAPDRTAEAQMEAEADAFARMSATSDWEEGVRAFLEKRPAQFGAARPRTPRP